MVLILLLVSMISVGAIWRHRYLSDLYPVHILTVDQSKCFGLTFGKDDLARGRDVDALLQEFGLYEEGGCYFALREHVSPEFSPDGFHQVKGVLLKQNGDPGKIYFYSYKARYQPIVWEP